MQCRKCGAGLPEKALFCHLCGTKQSTEKQLRPQNSKRRGNGQGSVYRLPNKSYIAVKVLGYYTDENGEIHCKKISKSGFKTKREAIEYLPQLTRSGGRKAENPNFLQVYDLFEEDYSRKNRTKSTLDCYRAAKKHFAPLYYSAFKDIEIDDWQECLDECEKGKRTRQNMRTLCSLLYKYAIPRGLSGAVNMSGFLFVGGEAQKERNEFLSSELDIVRANIGRVFAADYIYCNCYLGFRPSEFLNLRVEDYNRTEKCFVGGGKTEAGTNRTVTVSPKIQPYIDTIIGDRTSGHVFCDPDGKPYTLNKYREEAFYPALEAMGLPNPPTGQNGDRRKLTPHCCRHTFATMMKNVQAPDKDKLELIGHTSIEMLAHYHHTNYDDLRRITDRL